VGLFFSPVTTRGKYIYLLINSNRFSHGNTPTVRLFSHKTETGSPVQVLLLNCLQGFVVSEINSESEHTGGPNPWNVQQQQSIISVGFWRWCVNIKRIVFLDFIHCLVSQEKTKLRKNKIYRQKNTIHTSTKKSDKGQLLTKEQLTCAHTHMNPRRQSNTGGNKWPSHCTLHSS
jgi:hypothetical protein